MNNGNKTHIKNQNSHVSSVKNKRRQNGMIVNKNQIISGYFIEDQSYKQMRIERLNNALCFILGFFVIVCLVANYIVVVYELKLNKIRKDTLALNYENEELQGKLDNLRSYRYVDETVSKSNILQKAQKIIELKEKPVPVVDLKNKLPRTDDSFGFLGY